MYTDKQYAVTAADDAITGTVTLKYDGSELMSAQGICTLPADMPFTDEECQNLMEGIIATIVAEAGE
jgi:hypothetical protein